MTREEFLRGWTLLVIQPWGRAYNQLDEQGRPTAAALAQMEFYFTKLAWGHAQAWREVAERYAMGKVWPSLDELRVSLQHGHSRYVSALPDRRKDAACECPAEVRAQLDRLLGREAFSFGADVQVGKA